MKTGLFSFLMILFLVMSLFLAGPGTEIPSEAYLNSEKEFAGKGLFQKHNCTACHQFFGLGGYLGPDLTNFYTRRGGNLDYLRAILISGIGVMPSFNLEESEMESLMSYFKKVDLSGKFPDPKRKFNHLGTF